MILRRFAQSLKEQDSAAVVIGFVLLVLGVFLGLRVANCSLLHDIDAETTSLLATIDKELAAP